MLTKTLILSFGAISMREGLWGGGGGVELHHKRRKVCMTICRGGVT